MIYENPHQIGLIGLNGTLFDFPTRRAILIKLKKKITFLF